MEHALFFAFRKIPSFLILTRPELITHIEYRFFDDLYKRGLLNDFFQEPKISSKIISDAYRLYLFEKLENKAEYLNLVNSLFLHFLKQKNFFEKNIISDQEKIYQTDFKVNSGSYLKSANLRLKDFVISDKNEIENQFYDLFIRFKTAIAGRNFPTGTMDDIFFEGQPNPYISDDVLDVIQETDFVVFEEINILELI